MMTRSSAKLALSLLLVLIISGTLFVFAANTGHTQTGGGPDSTNAINEIIPYSRRLNWAPGLYIPYKSVVVNVLDYGARPNDGRDDGPAIQDAIYAARDKGGGAVYLPAGTYDIKTRAVNDGALNLPSNVVLRGDGPKSTTLRFNLSAYSNPVAGIRMLAWNYGDFVNVTGGYNHGSWSITVADASQFKAGDFAEILETNDGSIGNESWAQDAVGEMVEITKVEGNRLSLAEQLHYAYEASRKPRIRRVTVIRHAGVEDLHLERTDAGSGQMILIYNAADVWVRNVEGEHVLESQVLTINTYRCEIRDSYFHDAWGYGGGGQGYGVNLEKHTTSCLVENNLFRNFRHSMVVQIGASGNVFAYNYSTDRHYTYYTDLSVHGHYPSYNLFEGNIVQEINSSDAWGASGPGNTFLRNCVQNDGIQLKHQSNTHNLVGNVLNYYPNSIRIDPDVKDTLVHGNFTDGALQWDPSISDHNIPSSYYLSSKPSFFGGMRWPSIGPDIDTNSNDCVNPAQQRWLQQATPTPTPPPGTPVPTPTTGPTPTPTATSTPTPSPTPTPRGQKLVELTPAADTFISEWYPDDNFGARTALRVRSSSIEQALLQFDLSSLPQNILLDEAQLQVTVTNRSNSNPLTVKVYRLLKAWRESEANYRQARNGVAWEQPGAKGSGDRDPNQIGARRLPSSGSTRIDVKAAVADWLARPASNQGILLSGESDGSVYYALGSRESSPDQRPKLLVRYRLQTPATPTVTPTEVSHTVWLPLIQP